MSGEKRIECPKCGKLFVRGRLLEDQTFGCRFCETLINATPEDIIEGIPRAVLNKDIEIKPIGTVPVSKPILYKLVRNENETNNTN